MLGLYWYVKEKKYQSVDFQRWPGFNYLSSKLVPVLECSPTFNGIPVAATFLLYQAQSIFSNEFPGLEISAVFEVRPQKKYGYITRDDVKSKDSQNYKTAKDVVRENENDSIDLPPNLDDHDKYTHDNYSEYNYREFGGMFPFERLFPSNCEVIVPIFEKLSQLEEARLGEAGITKPVIGRLKIIGECSTGCAKVRLQKMILYKLNGEIVWTWDRPMVQMRD